MQLAGAEWAMHNLGDQFYIVADDGADQAMLVRMLAKDIDMYGGTVRGNSTLSVQVGGDWCVDQPIE